MHLAHGPSHVSSHQRKSLAWPPAAFENRPASQVMTSPTKMVVLGRKQQIADLLSYGRIVMAEGARDHITTLGTYVSRHL
jgi:hypothetical protein